MMLQRYLKPGLVPIKWIVLASIVMMGSVALAAMLKPSRYWSEFIGEPHYADVVPHAFGDWQELPPVTRSIVDPVVAEGLARIYTETLARNFVHKPTGRVIMLSIAYGRDQSTDTQLHTPEQCYPSQGFRVDDQSDVTVHTPYGELQGIEMSTRLGERPEPLTFFVRVGDKVVRGSKARNLARLAMGMQGFLVDGMLLRVSEISRQPQQSYQLQQRFIADLLGAVGPKGRQALIGRES